MPISYPRPWIRRYSAMLSVGTVALLTLAACASNSSASSSDSSTKAISIGFSQAFSSNSWQTANNAAAESAIKVLKKQGKISSYKFLDANNSVSTQISQINDLILAHVSVILIDPTSSTALNGVIAKATAAKIPVLVFSDGPVTSTKPYELEFPLKQYEVVSAQYIAQRLHGKGNVLDIRGVAGTGGDQTMQSGVIAGFKPYPGIKIVGSVYGGWDEATTESKVAQLLPSLPKIDAVIQQGGEGYGVAQAFQAAGRPIPLIVMGNRGEELRLWSTEHQKNGYTTMSMSANPGIGASAVYVGYAIATGQKVPKSMVFPNLTITQSDLSQYTNIPTGGVATKSYSQAWTQQNVIH
jgi:ribose transport system substrate-binding protein